jgi:hypothetical protein
MRTLARVNGLGTLGLLLAAFTAPAESLSAQQAARWRPFVGCWEPMGVEGDAGLLCFRPAGDGVEMFNVFEGDVTARERLLADGVPRAVAAEGCQGSESVTFSEDGRRVFTGSTYMCEGGESRTGSGVMSFISPTQWIDVRSLTVDGEPVAWIQRYAAATAEGLRDHEVDDPAAADPAGVRGGRALAARDIEIGDVEEALGKLDPEAVKIWVATLESEFELSGSELIRLADSGVPEDVIDVMVAVSYPERYALTPEGVPENVVDRVSRDAYRAGGRFGYRAFLWDPFYAPIGYRYGYSPYGYYGYGYGGYYGYVPASVVVVPVGPSPTGGRTIRGQGYRGPSSSGGSSGGSGAARSSPRPSGSSSDGGGSSSSGSPGTRRTAQPRN